MDRDQSVLKLYILKIFKYLIKFIKTFKYNTMTEYELSTFENFLLNSKQGVLDKMIKGTDIFNYFKYLQILSEP